jgi:hypothetical protein
MSMYACIPVCMHACMILVVKCALPIIAHGRVNVCAYACMNLVVKRAFPMIARGCVNVCAYACMNLLAKCALPIISQSLRIGLCSYMRVFLHACMHELSC